MPWPRPLLPHPGPALTPPLSAQARFPLHRLLVTARLGEAVAEQEVAGV